MVSSMFRFIRSKRPQLRVGLPLVALTAAVLPAYAARAATELPNGTYVYAIAENGKNEATSTIVVTRSGNEVIVSEHASPMEAEQIVRRVYDATTFATRTYARMVGNRTFAAVQIAGNTASVTDGDKKSTFAATPDAPFAVFDAWIASFAQLPVVLHHVPAQRVTLVNLFLGSPTSVIAALPSTSARPAQVPAADVATDLRMDGRSVTMWYDPQTFVLDAFELPQTHFSFTLTSRSDNIETLP